MPATKKPQPVWDRPGLSRTCRAPLGASTFRPNAQWGGNVAPAPCAAWEPGRCVPDADLGLTLYLFRYYNRNRIGCREGILEGIVEHLFLVPPRALGAVDVVVTSFVLRIGIHFNFPDPALDVPIVNPSAGPERRNNFAVSNGQKIWCAGCGRLGTRASRRLLLAVSRISRRRPPAAGLQTRRQSLAQRAAEEPWPADPHQRVSAAGSGHPEIRAHRTAPSSPTIHIPQFRGYPGCAPCDEIYVRRGLGPPRRCTECRETKAPA